MVQQQILSSTALGWLLEKVYSKGLYVVARSCLLIAQAGMPLPAGLIARVQGPVVEVQEMLATYAGLASACLVLVLLLVLLLQAFLAAVLD